MQSRASSLQTKNLFSCAERPSLPRVSCGPQQYVLANTNATCTCNTSSVGQPAGYLIWIIGDQTDLETTATEGQQNFPSHELHYAHFFTQADHGRTWFRCDVVWGLETIRGENYTVNVGCMWILILNFIVFLNFFHSICCNGFT